MFQPPEHSRSELNRSEKVDMDHGREHDTWRRSSRRRPRNILAAACTRLTPSGLFLSPSAPMFPKKSTSFLFHTVTIFPTNSSSPGRLSFGLAQALNPVAALLTDVNLLLDIYTSTYFYA